MGLDRLDPVDRVGDGILGGVIGSNGHAICCGFSSLEFEDADDVSIEVVGDASDVFEFIGHSEESRLIVLSSNFVVFAFKFMYYQIKK
jgi:hypothetical protein